MADVSCAGADVLSGEIDMPLRGAWTATLESASEAIPSGRVAITVARADGGFDTFSGTVVHGSSWQGRAQFQIVAGAGRMSDEIGPLNYSAHPIAVEASVIAEAIINGTDETFADGALDALAAFSYGRLGSPIATRGRHLTRITDDLGMNWRVLDSGAIHVGVETYPESDEQPFRVDPGDVGASKILHVAPDGATMRPGITIFGRQIHRVRYLINANIRAELHYL